MSRSQSHLGRRSRRVLLTFSTLAFTGLASGTLAVRADTVPAGAVTRLSDSLSNVGYDSSNPLPTSDTTTVITDPANGFLAEDIVTGCNVLASYNIDTYAPGPATACQSSPPFAQVSVFADNLAYAVDSTDGLLFVVDGPSQASSATADAKILALSEKTLAPVASWTVPSGGPGVISGLSWYPATNQLVVLADRGGTSGAGTPPGVNLLDYDIKASLTAASAGSVTPTWDVAVPGCLFAMQANWSANAYLAQEPTVADPSKNGLEAYVPCQFASTGTLLDSTVFNGDVPRGVVKMDVTDACTTSSALPGSTTQCPALSAQAPTPSNDFIFDPTSGRGFLPSTSNSGITVLVYDGATGDYQGRSAIGGVADTNHTSLAFDQVTGRLYGIGPEGLTLIDGRRTPLNPGTRLADDGGTTAQTLLPVLPPDTAHPYTRLLANLQSPCGCTGNWGVMPSFTVFADTYTVSQDPPAAAVDAHTHSGSINAGDQLSSTYSGNASGYGVHVDFVGSYGAAIDNPLQGQVDGSSLPLGGGNRDVLAAEVGNATLSNGAAQAAATPLGDINGSTGTQYSKCTNLQSAGTCSIPACPHFIQVLEGTLGQPLCPTAPDTSSAPNTGQAWPLQTAGCSNPGPSTNGSANGVFVTTGHDSQGVPQQSMTPGTDQFAQATVDCSKTNPASTTGGTAHLRGIGLTSPQGGIAVGEAAVDSALVEAPLDAQSPISSTVDAAARNIRVSDAQGDTLSIGSVEQLATAQAAGRPGTAHATRTLVISDVILTQAGGQPNVICHGACAGDPEQFASHINGSGLPIRILDPTPESFLLGGSPGGYTSAVVAGSAEQLGDQQFNGMGARESAYLPGLRIVVYNDGPYSLNRSVIDLAGVEADAYLGITDYGAAIPPQAPVSPAAASIAAGATAPSRPVAVAAGHPIAAIPGTPDRFVYDNSPAGRNGSQSSGSVASQGGGGYDTAPPALAQSGIIQRILAGLGWSGRSWRQALEMLGMFALLGLPLILIARRRVWFLNATGDQG